MSIRTESYEVEGTPRIEFTIAVGEARVVEGPAGTVTVTLDGSDRVVESYVIEKVAGSTIVVRPEDRRRFRFGSGVDLIVAVGPGADVEGKVASADIAVDVVCRRLTLSTASGDVRVADVEGDAMVKTASGDVRLARVGGEASIQVASGDVVADRVTGRAHVVAASGDVRLREIEDRATVKTAAGDVVVERFSGTDLNVKTLAGDVRVGIPQGRVLDVDIQSLSGDISSAFDPSDGSGGGVAAKLKVVTVSGDVALSSA